MKTNLKMQVKNILQMITQYEIIKADGNFDILY